MHVLLPHPQTSSSITMSPPVVGPCPLTTPPARNVKKGRGMVQYWIGEGCGHGHGPITGRDIVIEEEVCGCGSRNMVGGVCYWGQSIL